MYSNIGGKIKGLAVFIAWVGIILSVIVGINIATTGNVMGAMSGSDELEGLATVLGIVVIIIGSILSWVGSFLLYGFGQLVENSDEQLEATEKLAYKIAEVMAESAASPVIAAAKKAANTSSYTKTAPAQAGSSKSDDYNRSADERRAQLYKLLEAGLITEEEYVEKVSKF